MVKRVSKSIVALIAFACAYTSPLQAHHSNSVFDMSTHIWLKGTVLSYELINPHAMIELEEHIENGQTRRWIIEGPNPVRLDKLNIDDDFINIGDVIEVCGFFLKSDVSRDSRVHGHVMVMPDGKTWQWGPYGHLEKCVNPDDWDSIERGTNQLRIN